MKKKLSLLCCIYLFTRIYPKDCEPQQKIYVTIFVHGAISIKPFLNLPNLIKLIQDDLHGTVYKEAVKKIRNDPYIWQTQAMMAEGLQKIDMYDDRPSATATLFAHLYDKVLKKVYPARTETDYYCYGWSGLFSHSIRSEEAGIFYYSIKELHHQYAYQYPDKEIHITAIGYSHGGNIILGAGQTYTDDSEKDFTFDEAILIGTPIQTETKHCVEYPLFEKVYHFYSRSDKVVVLDFFSLNRFFSHRYFHQKGRKQKCPENLLQIELQASGPKLCVKKLRNKKTISHYKTDSFSPGHTELWSFGWIESGFRSDYPYYPLPIGIYLPYFKFMSDNYNYCHQKHFVEKIDFEKNTLSISERFNFKKQETPFLDRYFLEELQAYVEQKRPKEFKRYEYDERINQAITNTKATFLCEAKEDKKRKICKIKKSREQSTSCLA